MSRIVPFAWMWAILGALSSQLANCMPRDGKWYLTRGQELTIMFHLTIHAMSHCSQKVLLKLNSSVPVVCCGRLQLDSVGRINIACSLPRWSNIESYAALAGRVSLYSRASGPNQFLALERHIPGSRVLPALRLRRRL